MNSPVILFYTRGSSEVRGRPTNLEAVGSSPTKSWSFYFPHQLFFILMLSVLNLLPHGSASLLMICTFKNGFLSVLPPPNRLNRMSTIVFSSYEVSSETWCPRFYLGSTVAVCGQKIKQKTSLFQIHHLSGRVNI